MSLPPQSFLGIVPQRRCRRFPRRYRRRCRLYRRRRQRLHILPPRGLAFSWNWNGKMT